VKDTICFETKKGAKKVLAVTGMTMKKERLPLMDKDVVGATLAPTLALICMLSTGKSIVKGTTCFETKKDAEPVHAVSGMIGKKEMLPLMDKDVAGATLELRPALTCFQPTAPTAIPTATVISTATKISTATVISTATEIPTAIQ